MPEQSGFGRAGAWAGARVGAEAGGSMGGRARGSGSGQSQGARTGEASYFSGLRSLEKSMLGMEKLDGSPPGGNAGGAA